MNKRTLNTGLLLTTLVALATSVAATLADGYVPNDVVIIIGAIGAALSALFVDRDGDGMPPLFDNDEKPAEAAE